ncbi:MAG: hypothetical protein BalsKO_16700 [Balneolaceae bacterium]
MINTKLYITGLAIMLILNGVLIFLLLQNTDGPPKKRGNNESLKEKISQQLQLTNDQVKAYEILSKEHQKATKNIERKQKDLARAYFSQLKESDPDSVFLSSQLLELQTLDAQKIALTYSHFEDLKRLCTNEQKAKFEKIVDEILLVLLSEQENRPPPPPRPRDN